MLRFLLPFAVAGLFALAAPPVRAADLLPVDQIREGMTGYGLSVFEGGTVARFEVVVLGVLRNILPRHDLVLVRCTGSPVLEKAGIIAGMSGSPIYLDGRLAGALSRAFPGAKEAIALFTPIQDMLDEGGRRLEYGRYWKAGERARLRPCATPLFAGGFSPRALALLEERLGPFGLLPLEGGGGGGAAGPAPELVPGAAVGFQLMRGDWTLTGVGTVTHVDGDRVFAFGHPFLQGGEVSMPMVSARVHTVVANQDVSFKLASPVAEIGSLVQDQISCVMGVRGRTCDLLPVSLRLSSPGGGRDHAFRVEVIRNPAYTGMLVRAALLNAIETLEPGTRDCTLDVSLKVGVRGHAPVEVRDRLSSAAGPLGDGFGLFRAFSLIDELLDNPFERVHLDAVDVVISRRPVRCDAEILTVRVREPEVAPGDPVHVLVQLKPYGGSPVVRELELRVPMSVPRGSFLAVRVAGGALASPTPAAPPTSLAELMRVAAARRSSQTLVAALDPPGMGVVYRGFQTRSLPPSVLHDLAPLLREHALLVPDTLEAAVETEWVVQGAMQALVRIR